MTATELKEKENDVLQQELVAQTKHLFDLRSQAVTEKLEDPSQIGKTRKTIARIKTLLRQREIEASKKTETAAK
jgi:large subunit ribosomal protein L29